MTMSLVSDVHSRCNNTICRSCSLGFGRASHVHSNFHFVTTIPSSSMISLWNHSSSVSHSSILPHGRHRCQTQVLFGSLLDSLSTSTWSSCMMSAFCETNNCSFMIEYKAKYLLVVCWYDVWDTHKILWENHLVSYMYHIFAYSLSKIKNADTSLFLLLDRW